VVKQIPATIFTSGKADKANKEGLFLNLYVQPGASKTEFVGVYDGRLKLKVKEKAQEMAANSAVILAIANLLKMPKSLICIENGLTNRRKLIFIKGDAELIEAKLSASLSHILCVDEGR
jgi:uncharacterized protein (TIGR00251 family)